MATTMTGNSSLYLRVFLLLTASLWCGAQESNQTNFKMALESAGAALSSLSGDEKKSSGIDSGFLGASSSDVKKMKEEDDSFDNNLLDSNKEDVSLENALESLEISFNNVMKILLKDFNFIKNKNMISSDLAESYIAMVNETKNEFETDKKKLPEMDKVVEKMFENMSKNLEALVKLSEYFDEDKDELSQNDLKTLLSKFEASYNDTLDEIDRVLSSSQDQSVKSIFENLRIGLKKVDDQIAKKAMLELPIIEEVEKKMKGYLIKLGAKFDNYE